MMLLQLTLLAPLHLLWVAGSAGQPLPPCGGYLEGSRNGTITSPNFPSAHKTPLECIWTIRNPKPGRHYIYVYLLQNYLSCQSSALTYLEYQSVSNLTDSYIYSSNFNSRNDCGGSLHRIRSSKAFLQVKLTSMLTRLSSTSSGLFGFNATYTTMPTDNQPMPICSQSCSEAGFCRSLQDYSGFYCECFEGFSGRHCQYNDICDYRRRLNPCLNNGTCTVVKYGAQTSVVCACQRGYLGERCEKIITCPVLQEPPNGKVSPPPCRESRSRVGETCYFTCDNTYVQSGPSFKTCLSDGYWTQEKESTVCRDVTPPYFGDTCPGDMNLKNERCENKVLLNFTVPTAVDNSGYVKVDGPETKPPIYLAGGQYTWIYTASDASSNEARCQIAIGVQVVKCPTIKVPHNGEVTSKSCGSLYGSEVQFVCKEGFKLMGSGIRTCGPTGEWEGGDVQCIGAPYTPFKLELSDKRAASVILSWTPWPSDHRPSEHFIVQYQTTFEPSVWREMIGFVPGNVTKSLLELSPFVNYRFRVIAVNWVGRSDPSGASESYHTPPSAPEVFPKNIQAQGIYNRDLIVRWDPLGWYERNGPGVQYKIFWRILYCNDELLGDWESSVVQGEEKSSYVILNLIRDLPYQVQVQVLNNQGAGPISYPPVIGHAGDQAGRPGTRAPCATFEATLPPRITSGTDGSLKTGENIPWMSSASTFPDLKYVYPTDAGLTQLPDRGVLDQSNDSLLSTTSVIWTGAVTYGVGFDIVNFFEDYSGIVETRLLITCIARGPRRMRFKWFKGEYRIMASDWTRISVSPKVIRNDGDLESVLEINPTTPLDRGTYRCAVSDKGVERSCSLNITVLTKPSVQLDPVTATVLVSSPVKLTCTVRSPGGVDPQVKWFIGKDRVTDLRAIENLGSGMYRLTVLGTVEGKKYTCMASNAAGTTIAESIVTVVRKDAHDVCGQETFQNVEWGMTQAGGVYYQLCPGGSTGYATRQCLINEMDFTPYWMEPNFVQCTTFDFEALLSNTRMLTSGIEVTSVEKIAETLNSITTPNLYGGNLRLASDIIQEMILYKEKTKRAMSRRELEDVLWSASNVLSLYNKEEWMNLQEGSSGSSWVLGNLTRYSRLVTFELAEGQRLSTSTDNLVMEVGKVAVKGLDVIEFPATPKARTWVGTDRIEVPGKALRNSYEESQVVGVSSFLYRTIKDLLPGNDFLLRDSKIINTRVISLSLFPPPPGQLDPPVRVELAHENASFVDPECVSWDFGIQLPNRTTRGGWSTEGCAVLLSNESHTVCQCKHLTDFAVLVTPFVPKMDSPSANEISFIVAIGCGIAMLEIASVILVYILLWRCIRCDRSVIVLNLSLSLLNANGVFLGGIPQKWNKTICTAVAAMLHYFFLAAFCWMLAEGWHMYSSLVRTNGKLSKAKLYIALGWLLPAAVVGVSLGITKTNGYGNDKHCWITLDSQLPLALAAPACAVVAANLVILLLVVKAMLNSMAKKVDKDRTRTALWSSCVILPLLAATVVLAVFAVNRSAVLFQYLFAMCNTLLGLFMLLFYCIGNKQVLDIVKSRMCASEETDPPSDPDVAISAQNPSAKKIDANGRPITYTAAVHVDGPMTVVEKIDHVTHEEHEMEMIDVVVTSEQERRAQAEALLRRQGHSRTLERDPRYGPCPKPRQAAEQRPVSLEVPIHTMPRNPRGHDGGSTRMMTTFKPDDMEQYHTASTLRVQLDPRPPTKPQPGAIRVLPGHGPGVAQGKHLDYEPVKHSSCEELDRTDKYKADHVVMNTNASPSPHIVEGQTLSRAAFRSLKRSLSNPKWKQQGQPEGPSDHEATPSSIEMTEFYKSYSDI
ncbi:ADGRB3 [Branchiostoma lanceolatum]|uniref:ADGRB3 protein n=1 Tax=Branchiostoma lanceolatum TaxID=7740 RepID=A0A8K0ELK5_BRALA|nr:ADGRB3 [Branchiostoma lanceolatum]